MKNTYHHGSVFFCSVSTTMVHHCLVGASVVFQYMYLCIDYAFVVEPIFVINMVGYEISDVPIFKFKTCDF